MASFVPLSPSPSPPHALFPDPSPMLAAHPHPLPHNLHPSLLAPVPLSAPPTLAYEYAQPVALPPSESPPPQMQGKRYRSAPAKTFQCSGYGDCRMVFSRSEHLARHIRKHTGERPFTCHCSKQFSRLDNLRQHAQTVHSAPEDKPLNERMMRALAGINASMMAGVRGRRRYGTTSADAAAAVAAGSYGASCPSPASSSSYLPSASSSSAASSPYSDGFGHGHGFPLQGYPSGSHSLPTSPSYPTFPAHAHQSPYGSPPPSAFDSPASLFEAPDYLAAGSLAATIKQEEADSLEEFYAQVNRTPADAAHPALSSYASSSSLSSLSSLSSAPASRARHSASPLDGEPLRAHHPYPQHGSPSSAGSASPVGSPRGEQFWAGQPAAASAPQPQREYLPSPPESPAYFASGHAAAAAAPYGWAASDGEMSNAQYYAALQAQQQPQPSSEGYFYAHQQPPHPHAAAPGYVYA